MPARILRLTPSGLRSVDYSAASLDDAARNEPRQGVYTVSRTYHQTRTLLLDAHLQRLEASARHEGIALQVDRRRLRSALRQMILAAGFGDVRFRISVSAAAPDELLLTIEPFSPPPGAVITRGVRCRTSSASRHHPSAKTSDWMHIRRSLEASRPGDIYETILLDARGSLLEGMSSNFYAEIDGQLFTAVEGALAGVSRRIVFEICPGVLPLRKRAPQVDDIPRFSGAFLTSSSRGIIPVIAIDGQPLGDGSVSQAIRVLQRKYRQWVAARLEEL